MRGMILEYSRSLNRCGIGSTITGSIYHRPFLIKVLLIEPELFVEIWSTIPPEKETKIEKIIGTITLFDNSKTYILRGNPQLEGPILKASNFETRSISPKARLKHETDRINIDTKFRSGHLCHQEEFLEFSPVKMIDWNPKLLPDVGFKGQALLELEVRERHHGDGDRT